MARNKKQPTSEDEITGPVVAPADEAVQPLAPYGAVYAAWEYASHEQRTRGLWWYIVAGVIVVSLLIYTYFSNNFLLGVIVVLSALVFAVTEYRGSETYTFAITEDGLLAGPVFYPYAEIRNFFIIFEPPQVTVLYFDPKSVLRPLLGIPLQGQDPTAIRQLLLEHLPEDIEREHEPTSDFIGRLFRF